MIARVMVSVYYSAYTGLDILTNTLLPKHVIQLLVDVFSFSGKWCLDCGFDFCERLNILHFIVKLHNS